MPYVNGYLGKLTKDPVLKQTQSGKQTCNFTVASEKGWGDKKKTDFVPCIAWEKTASTISVHYKKGDSILVQGEWENHPWQKNEKGYDIQNWQYVVKSIVFLPKPKARIDEDEDYMPASVQMSGVNRNADIEYSGTQFAPVSDELEDLPF